jgi:hypothetical protein
LRRCRPAQLNHTAAWPSWPHRFVGRGHAAQLARVVIAWPIQPASPAYKRAASSPAAQPAKPSPAAISDAHRPPPCARGTSQPPQAVAPRSGRRVRRSTTTRTRRSGHRSPCKPGAERRRRLLARRCIREPDARVRPPRSSFICRRCIPRHGSKKEATTFVRRGDTSLRSRGRLAARDLAWRDADESLPRTSSTPVCSPPLSAGVNQGGVRAGDPNSVAPDRVDGQPLPLSPPVGIPPLSAAGAKTQADAAQEPPPVVINAGGSSSLS